VINLLLNLALIPTYGMTGAAIATSAGYGSLVVTQTIVAHRLGYRPLAGIRPRPSVATIIVSAVAILLVSSLLESSILSLLVVPPLGAVVFAFASIATGAITDDDVAKAVDATTLPSAVERRLVEMIDRIPTFHD